MIGIGMNIKGLYSYLITAPAICAKKIPVFLATGSIEPSRPRTLQKRKSFCHAIIVQ